MPFNTLSGRFLGLTIVFVLIAEVLVSVPSIARFRENYLQSRLEHGQIAAIALLATPDDKVTADVGAQLLAAAGVLNVVLRRENVRELVLPSPDDPTPPPTVDASFNLVTADQWTLMRDALEVLFIGKDRVIQVIGTASQGGEVEVAMDEAPLRTALADHARRILYISLGLSLAMAALLFLAVQLLIVRPIDRVVAHMTAFRDDPEDPTRIIAPQEGARELREAEEALKDLEVRLTGALRQKERLAGLGSAVAKISHDLRNMLTTAQLLADRIEASGEPAVQRTAPKLVGSLARAINLCERTLAFGRAEELPPETADFPLAPLVAEVLENEQHAAGTCARFGSTVPAELLVRADADQLFRVLSNLVRNAAQAIEATGRPGTVSITAGENGTLTEIRVRDSGPGLPEKARENLFRPFTGSVRPGGTGLGLVIAAELVRGHGGVLVLEETGPRGSTFRISLPAPGRPT